MSSQMEVSPKKRFGQHFLRDSGVLDRIVALIRPAAGDVFVEIGAGTGALTGRIAPRVSRLFAVEFDRDVIPPLTSSVASFPGVTVVQEDVLRLDLNRFLPEVAGNGDYRVAGNLPYNIGTAVIERFLYAPVPARDMTFMLQLEVAERIVAKPGSRSYGFLSVLVQHRAEPRIAFKVRPGSFLPPPKVMSAVLTLHPLAGGCGTKEESWFLAVAGAAFGHRRKTVLNALRLSGTFGGTAATLLERAGIDGSRRAEQLTVAEYEKLGVVAAEMS
jgi:16S rRNA (adenine1518-N6/adenine1519-N6)-dimethyltransferase